MSTFYLNVDSTGVDKLLMGPGIYWSYATDGTSYTLTPVFDTTLITLPSDVQVWYSNDGTNFAYSPAWITSRTGDTITVTVASSTTVTAKLYYASGTVVTDENDAEVASVSTVIGGAATTIGTVTVAGSTTPTEGVAETYSATISGNATDQTYLWTTTDASAVIATPTAASTDITFSTSGSFNVTCTVSSATATDSPQADTLGVTVAAASEILGTCTGWAISGSEPVRNANGWSAGAAGTGTTDMWLRNDAAAGYIWFASQADRDTWLSTFSGYQNITITHGGGVYSMSDASLAIFTATTVGLNGTWSGTIPTDSASTVEIAP